MMAAPASFAAPRSGLGFDLVGFAALSVTPALAVYQGVVAALGVLAPLPEASADLVPLATIVGCLLLRLTSVRSMLASPAIRRASLWLVGYLVVVVASTLLVFLDPIERDPSKMLQQLLGTIPAILTFFVMATGPSPGAVMRSLRASIIVWSVAAVLTPLSALTPLPIGEVQGTYVGSQGLRSFGVLGDGGTYVISFLVVAFFASRRLFWFALSLFALILSGSRAALLIAGGGLALTMVMGGAPNARARVGGRLLRAGLAGLSAMIVLIAVQVVFAAVSERFGIFNAFTRLTETQLTESDRLLSITRGLEWFQLSPLYGHGFNAYYYFSLRSAMFGANQTNALNQTVQTLMDGGLLAFAFLALFFVQVVKPGPAPMVDRQADPFAIRIWLVAFLIINQAAVFILPAFFLTILVFGLAGVMLYLRESAWTAEPPAGLAVSVPSRVLARSG